MPASAEPTESPAREQRMHGGTRLRYTVIGIAVGFGLLYLWDLIEAIGNLTALLRYADLMGRSLNSFAWLVLATAIAIPPLTYTLAVVLGHRRHPARFALALLSGLAAVACLSLVCEALLRS